MCLLCKGSKYPALGSPTVSLVVLPVFHVSSFEKIPDKTQDFLIRHTSLNQFQQLPVRDVVEAAFDVAFDDPTHALVSTGQRHGER